MATVSQDSYPLNSENANPPGTCRVYLSWAEMTLPPKTASTPVAIQIFRMLLRFIAVRPLLAHDRTGAARRMAKSTGTWRLVAVQTKSFRLPKFLSVGCRHGSVS